MEEKELLILAKTDEFAVEELLKLYKPLVNKIARRYFLLSGDSDDIIQEGMIGLYRAIKTFEEGKEASFKTYAYLCISRQITNLIKKEHSQKNEVFLELFGSDVLENLDIPTNRENPEQNAISNQNMEYIESQIKLLLSDLELKILNLYLSGLSYDKIANKMNLSKKSVDNALFRVRQKLSHLLDDIKK